MCDLLGQLRDAVGRYAAAFDASLLSVEQASGAVAEAAAIEKMAATIKGLAAAQAAKGGAWKDAGDRSAAHHLARTTGTSVGQAGDALETARRLEKLPALPVPASSRPSGPQRWPTPRASTLLPRTLWWPRPARRRWPSSVRNAPG